MHWRWAQWLVGPLRWCTQWHAWQLATACDKVSIGEAVWSEPMERPEAQLATTWDGMSAGAAAPSWSDGSDPLMGGSGNDPLAGGSDSGASGS